jgi:hypothetical protein
MAALVFGGLGAAGGVPGFLLLPGPRQDFPKEWNEMKQNGTRKGDDALLAGLVSGLDVTEAAKQAGMGRTTAYRRLRDRHFQERLEELRTAVLHRTVSLLSDVAIKATKVVDELLGKEQTPTIRTHAARLALEFAVKFRGELGVAKELEILRQQVKEIKGRGQRIRPMGNSQASKGTRGIANGRNGSGNLGENREGSMSRLDGERDSAGSVADPYLAELIDT